MATPVGYQRLHLTEIPMQERGNWYDKYIGISIIELQQMSVEDLNALSFELETALLTHGLAATPNRRLAVREHSEIRQIEENLWGLLGVAENLRDQKYYAEQDCCCTIL